jgi:hypothetical protein
VNKRPGLSTRTVDRERYVHGSLHEKAIQDGRSVPIVIESIIETLVQDRLRIGTPDNALV